VQEDDGAWGIIGLDGKVFTAGRGLLRFHRLTSNGFLGCTIFFGSRDRVI
jgi:hypothetical protein